MSYYTSVVDGSRRCLALGPFRTHGAALQHVDKLRHWMRGRFADACWWSYGTAHDRGQHKPGRLNEQYGLAVDETGWAS